MGAGVESLLTPALMFLDSFETWLWLLARGALWRMPAIELESCAAPLYFSSQGRKVAALPCAVSAPLLSSGDGKEE